MLAASILKMESGGACEARHSRARIGAHEAPQRCTRPLGRMVLCLLLLSASCVHPGPPPAAAELEAPGDGALLRHPGERGGMLRYSQP